MSAAGRIIARQNWGTELAVVASGRTDAARCYNYRKKVRIDVGVTRTGLSPPRFFFGALSAVFLHIFSKRERARKEKTGPSPYKKSDSERKKKS